MPHEQKLLWLNLNHFAPAANRGREKIPDMKVIEGLNNRWVRRVCVLLFCWAFEAKIRTRRGETNVNAIRFRNHFYIFIFTLIFIAVSFDWRHTFRCFKSRYLMENFPRGMWHVVAAIKRKLETFRSTLSPSPCQSFDVNIFTLINRLGKRKLSIR